MAMWSWDALSVTVIGLRQPLSGPLRCREKGIQKGPQLGYATIFRHFFDIGALTASSFRFNEPEQMPFTAPLATVPPMLPLPAPLSLLARITLRGPGPGVVSTMSYVRLRLFGVFASVGVGWLAPPVEPRWCRLCRFSFGIAKFSYNVHSCVRCMWLRFSCGNRCRKYEKDHRKVVENPSKKCIISSKPRKPPGRNSGNIGDFAEN